MFDLKNNQERFKLSNKKYHFIKENIVGLGAWLKKYSVCPASARPEFKLKCHKSEGRKVERGWGEGRKERRKLKKNCNSYYYQRFGKVKFMHCLQECKLSYPRDISLEDIKSFTHPFTLQFLLCRCITRKQSQT
jgi:hypothetical protein